MKKAQVFIICLLTFLSTSSFQTNIPSDLFEWTKDVEVMLHEFMSCGSLTPPNTPCNVYLAKALIRVYRVKDFEKVDGGYLRANEIASYVKVNTDKWTLLGEASSQKVLDEAQGYANLKKAVIAVYEASGSSGHVAMIVPGLTTASGSWGLKCPNSTSFFINKPMDSYISKPLAYAFPANLKDKVLIYGRNYNN